MNLNKFHKIILAAVLAAQNFPAVAQTNSAAAPVDYSTFSKFITQRNIFDPDRQPNVPYVFRPRTTITPQAVKQADSFSLVGIIGYDEGRLAGVYAFFDGSNPDYRKAAQLNDSIAGFKVAGIASDSVTLVSGTNTMVLEIGEQLHDGGGGHWLFANGTTVRYNNGGGYGRGRNYSGRGGFGNGGRRRNNNSGNYNGGNFGNNNFNRAGNNFAAQAAASGDSQAGDQNMNFQDNNNMPDDNAAPDDNTAPENMAPPDDNNAPDAGTQDNPAVQQTDQPSAPPADSSDPSTTLQRLQQQRAQELQQTGH
jgi:hypothetical protein